MQVRVDERGLIVLTWSHGSQVTADRAAEAICRVDELNAGAEPLAQPANRDARAAFSHRCSASAIALLGQSPVDRVIANFALGVSAVPVPTRFFTSRAAAEEWLLRDTIG